MHFVNQDVIILNTLVEELREDVVVEFCVLWPGSGISFVPPNFLRKAMMLHNTLTRIPYVSKHQKRKSTTRLINVSGLLAAGVLVSLLFVWIAASSFKR